MISLLLYTVHGRRGFGCRFIHGIVDLDLVFSAFGLLVIFAKDFFIMVARLVVKVL